MPIPDHLKEIVSILPESPGIYKFFDKKGRLLYIGKSKNLKNRVRTYFRKQSDDAQERTLILIRNIHEIQLEQTETELEALILEDNLIKKHLPPYNVKQKKFKEQVYIAVTANKYPVIKVITNEEVDFTEQIFGPFKDKYAAEHLLYAVQKALKLRKCLEPTPVNKCLLSGIDKCLGPCRKEISSAAYNDLTSIAIDLLKGDAEPILKKLNSTIENCAKELDFEEAAKLRDLHNYCKNFAKRQKFMNDFINENVLINSDDHHFLFRRGELLKVYKRLPKHEKLLKLINSKKDRRTFDASHLMDRAYVVWVWMKQNRSQYTILDN